MEIAEEHSGLRAGNHQDEEHQEQEAKHVIRLWWPDGVEDEEQLDEDAAKGQHPTHDDARQRSRVHTLLGDLPWDLVCPHRVLQTLDQKEEHGEYFHLTLKHFCHEPANTCVHDIYNTSAITSPLW